MKLCPSQYGEIPEGWKYTNLGDLCTTVTKGTTPTTLGKEFVDKGITFVKGESISEAHSFNKDMFAFIDEETDELLKRSRIHEKDILFTIAGTLGKFAMVDHSILPANTNQAIAIIRIDPEKFDPDVLYTYFLGGWQTEFYKRKTQQAVQANLSLGTIKELPLLIPTDAILAKYSSVTKPMMQTVWKNHVEIERLIQLQQQMLVNLSSH